MAEQTSKRLASSIGTITPFSIFTCLAKASRVDTEINGMSKAKLKPLAAETPMRKPV